MGDITEMMEQAGLFDWWGEEDERPAPTCNRCGATPLEWVDIGLGRWRLYEGNKPHRCPRIDVGDAFADVKL